VGLCGGVELVEVVGGSHRFAGNESAILMHAIPNRQGRHEVLRVARSWLEFLLSHEQVVEHRRLVSIFLQST
jgi:hypothetical protein